MHLDGSRTGAGLRLVVALAAAGVVGGGCGESRVRDRGSGQAAGQSGPGKSPGVQPERPPPLEVPQPGATPAADAGPPKTCAEEVHQATAVPVDLLFLVDTSGSMGELTKADDPTSPIKWNEIRQALMTFLSDPGSSGLGAGLVFFPNTFQTCQSDSECFPIALPPGVGSGFLCGFPGVCVAAGASVPSSPCDPRSAGDCPAGQSCVPLGRCSVSKALCVEQGAQCPGGVDGDVCGMPERFCRLTPNFCPENRYSRLDAEIGQLPGWGTTLAATLAAGEPGGGTPMGPAVRGAMAALRRHAEQHPDRKSLLVLATDGLPSEDCAANLVTDVTAAIAGGRAGAIPLSTYVIGIFAENELAASQPALMAFAQAGGTDTPFVITPGDDLTSKFQMALEQIRGAVLSCEFALPTPASGTLDPDKVNLSFAGSMGAPQNIPYVGSADRCDPQSGGWYYDVDPAVGRPTRVIVCETTCTQFKSDPGGKAQLRVGCTNRVD